MATPTSLAAYLLLFVGVAAAFTAANLLVGWLLRPRAPSVEKGEVYECGEPVIGSSFVQFDIRFYVVALLFIVFDVEVAFFFPWAVAFGKATHVAAAAGAGPDGAAAAVEHLRALGFEATEVADPAQLAAAAQGLAWGLFADIGVFFAVLMVGFAYVWSRGDLDWVRTTVNAAPEPAAVSPGAPRAA